MNHPRPFHAGPLVLIALICCAGRAPAQDRVTMPDAAGQVMLIKNAIVAVNHASLTGNYTVLRDLGSQNFRQRNTAADLAANFGNLKRIGLDLSPILVTTPRYTQPPGPDARGRLQLVGFFPTQPRAVEFKLLFQHTPAGWTIDDITLSVKPIEALAGSPPAPPSDTGRPSPAPEHRYHQPPEDPRPSRLPATYR